MARQGESTSQCIHAKTVGEVCVPVVLHLRGFHFRGAGSKERVMCRLEIYCTWITGKVRKISQRSGIGRPFASKAEQGRDSRIWRRPKEWNGCLLRWAALRMCLSKSDGEDDSMFCMFCLIAGWTAKWLLIAQGSSEVRLL
jgi:hypothetical protein